jgi:hypothetical protein
MLCCAKLHLCCRSDFLHIPFSSSATLATNSRFSYPLPPSYYGLVCMCVRYHVFFSSFTMLLLIRAQSQGPGCTTAIRLFVHPVPPPFYRRSHCRRQMSPRPTRRERSKQREVELNGQERVAENFV